MLWGGSLPASTLMTQAAPSSRAFESLTEHLEGRADPSQGTYVLLTLGFSMLLWDLGGTS